MTYPQKSRSTSLIASAKRDQEGHILRHALVDLIRQERREVDILGRGYAPFEQKQDGLAPYRYSIVIENAQEPSYFTEKLIDAYICRTVPIYWGAPDIGRWFDTSGMIICDSLEELFQALERCSEQDYADRRAAIDRNAALARRYADTFSRAVDVLLSDQGETPPFG